MKEFEGYHVLLADDDEIAREIVANIVDDLGASCVTARDGEELLAILNGPDGDSIDLVLTDINMPNKSGIDACSEFRASEHPRAKTLPVIGISADTNPALFDNAISAGMNGMTMKPLTRETLHAHFHITLKDNKANAVFCERIQQTLAKSLFFSSVCHDLRTPLNAIIGFSEMLRGGFDTKEEHDTAVNSILMSGKTMLQLVNDILDVGKLESGRMEIVPEPTDVAALLKDIVTSFSVTNQKKGLEVRFRTVGEIPPLMVDPQRIRQIAFNLVGNAVKFTKEGFVELRAEFVRSGEASGTFTLAVEDTGCGISEADLKRLATPFVQVGAQKAKAGGTGLGLSICRKLAKAMGGELRIASVLGKGTTFAIVVPGVKVCLKSEGVMECGSVGVKSEELRVKSGEPDNANPPQLSTLNSQLPTPNSQPSTLHSSLSTLNSHRILVADDTKMNQLVLKTMFSKLGVKDMTFANNGREALDILRDPEAPPFDLVLTDLFMPEMTGEELVAEIRADPTLVANRVYLFTAEVEMKNTYAEKGFDGILLKPANLEDIRKLLP
jgi:signal transduction histidine kinase